MPFNSIFQQIIPKWLSCYVFIYLNSLLVSGEILEQQCLNFMVFSRFDQLRMYHNLQEESTEELSRFSNIKLQYNHSHCISSIEFSLLIRIWQWLTYRFHFILFSSFHSTSHEPEIVKKFMDPLTSSCIKIINLIAPVLIWLWKFINCC